MFIYRGTVHRCGRFFCGCPCAYHMMQTFIAACKMNRKAYNRRECESRGVGIHLEEREIMKSRTKGIICIVISAFCFALMNVCVRASGDLPSIEKSFFRNLVAAIVALIALRKNKTPMRAGKGNVKYLFLRSICGTIGILCNFYAVDHLVLSDASMLNKMSPFFVIIFSYLI